MWCPSLLRNALQKVSPGDTALLFSSINRQPKRHAKENFGIVEDKFKNKEEQASREKQLKSEAFSQFNANITLISLCYLSALTNVLSKDIDPAHRRNH